MPHATWKIQQHEGAKVVIEYTIGDKTYKTKLDNISAGMSETLLRQAVDIAIKSHYKTHRFEGLEGSTTLTILDTDDDTADKQDAADKEAEG